jgi:hypothetical protein
MADPKTFRTQDFYFAAFLRCSGVALVTVEHPDETGRTTKRPPPSVFVFESDKVEPLKYAWINGEDPVSASEYANQVKTLKTLVMRRE